MLQEDHKSIKRLIFTGFNSLLFLLVIIYWFNFQIFIASGDSMAPAIKNRQILLVAKFINEYSVGDIVVFSHEDQTLIKRIIATESDLVELKNGFVYVNSIQMRPYTYDGMPQEHLLLGNELFVIGDNHFISYDSRHFGPIIKSDVIGIVLNG